jgi:solute carrier family 1 (high affinity glutamate transporter) protein 1
MSKKDEYGWLGDIVPVTPISSSSISENSEKPKKKKSSARQIIKKQAKENVLLIATVLAVIFGIGLAFIIREYTNLTTVEKSYFGFPGELFLRMLKFLILPLVASSMITGIAGLGTSRAGKVAARALIYYFLTTISAVILGLVLVSTIKPGSRNSASIDPTAKDPLKGEKVTTQDTILDLIRWNFFSYEILTQFK